jgi:hypothetical protein
MKEDNASGFAEADGFVHRVGGGVLKPGVRGKLRIAERGRPALDGVA